MRAVPAALIRRFPALRIAARRSRALVRRLRFLCRAGLPHIEEKTVVFAAYGGRSYACSPKAIYEYMRDTPAVSYTHLIYLSASVFREQGTFRLKFTGTFNQKLFLYDCSRACLLYTS